MFAFFHVNGLAGIPILIEKFRIVVVPVQILHCNQFIFSGRESVQFEPALLVGSV